MDLEDRDKGPPQNESTIVQHSSSSVDRLWAAFQLINTTAQDRVKNIMVELGLSLNASGNHSSLGGLDLEDSDNPDLVKELRVAQEGFNRRETSSPVWNSRAVVIKARFLKDYFGL